MKKLFYLASSVSVYLSLAVPALADPPTPTPTPGPGTSVDPCTDTPTGIAATLCNLGGENAAQTIQSIVVFFVVLAVVIALLYLLYGGIKWITSKGDKTEVEAARNHIIAAIVGLIVVFLAVFIVTIILGAFGIGLTDLKIPTIVPLTPTPTP